MQSLDQTPLGFSDLTCDEVFVVSVYRHWQSCGKSCAEAEYQLYSLLKHDRLHRGLDMLFDIFRTLPFSQISRSRNDSAVLTLAEEALLNEIGAPESAQKPTTNIFRRLLHEVDATIRAAEKIPRSGDDQLIETIERKSSAVFDALYLGVRASQS